MSAGAFVATDCSLSVEDVIEEVSECVHAERPTGTSKTSRSDDGKDRAQFTASVGGAQQTTTSVTAFCCQSLRAEQLDETVECKMERGCDKNGEGHTQKRVFPTSTVQIVKLEWYGPFVMEQRDCSFEPISMDAPVPGHATGGADDPVLGRRNVTLLGDTVPGRQEARNSDTPSFGWRSAHHVLRRTHPSPILRRGTSRGVPDKDGTISTGHATWMSVGGQV